VRADFRRFTSQSQLQPHKTLEAAVRTINRRARFDSDVTTGDSRSQVLPLLGACRAELARLTSRAVPTTIGIENHSHNLPMSRVAAAAYHD
jgi:hypothetical protein